MTFGEDRSRWTFTMPTPLGDTECSYVVTNDELRFESDGPLGGGSDSVCWDAVSEGGTASIVMTAGRKASQMPRWIPTQMEWLVVSRASGAGKPFMRMLPHGPDRDAIVEHVRERLGTRWIGERVPLRDVQGRLHSGGGWGTLKIAGIVASVLALLVLLLIVLAILSTPLFLIPAGFVVGGWVFRNGLTGLRDAIAIANTPTAKASSAAMGMVELQGRTVTATPSPAAITGRPSVWWDVVVELWHQDSDRRGGWRQVAARYGGTIDVVELEDETGRVPIWLEDADLLIDEDKWEAGKDDLPGPGAALLEEIGYSWTCGKKIRVREKRLEADATIYVLGTLDERGRLPESTTISGIARLVELARSGEWRNAVVASVPEPLKIVFAVLFTFLQMFFSVGRGGARPACVKPVPRPNVPAWTPVVWKGRAGRPFLVSNRDEPGALTALRRRSLVRAAFGAVVLCYCLYQLIDLFLGR